MAEQTILIVEDDPDIRDGVRILLAGEGYHILEAENGLRALELFDPEVDLVILDIMMPGMSGLRVCEELRKTSAVPILFLTAKSQESDKLLGLTAGGDDYLAKPFSFAELSARVKALLHCVGQGLPLCFRRGRRSMKKQNGLAKQFMGMIVLAALESVLLLTVSQVVLAKGLRFWFSRTEVQQHATQKQVQELQSYVTEHHLASTDVKELTDWSHKRRYTLLELYRGQTMIYSSFAPKDGMISFLPQNGTSDQNPGVLVDKTGVYDWLPCYTLTFADGEVSAMLYYNGFNTYYGTGCEILLSLCILWWFPGFFLLNSRNVRYVVQLSEEIQAMEGGDLDHPITIRGSDEITTLASCLDSMRVTLRQQQEEEAQAAAKVKNLITEMSHDLRTPLTTLLLYTEILQYHKYETPEQADNYLNKIDAKARQIKQLSDNLFEYALVTRDTVAVLDPPAHFSTVFEEPLTEMVETLQQRGFACALELGEEDVLLLVSGQYVRRILDNITSNLVKYADPCSDILVRFVQEEDRAGLCFENRVLPVPASSESTKVGLPSIETMMEKMQGICRIEQPEGIFRMTLLFQTVKE